MTKMVKFRYECSEPFARSDYCFTVGGNPFAAEFDFVTDAFPNRESVSIFGETTYSISETTRLISGLRYTEDEVTACVKNFFTTCDNLKIVQMKHLEESL